MPAAPAAGTQGTGNAASEEVALQQQVAERDQEILRLRGEVEQARTRENDMRASLEQAARTLGSGSARTNRAGADNDVIIAPGSGAAPRPDVVVAALRAALSQEQERRELVETQLDRLKEETSASYAGPRVPESDYLAVKQELVLLRQALADEQAAHQRLSAATQVAGVPEPAPPSVAESADLRIRLEHLQAERDTVVAALNTNLTASQKRVAELEQQLGSAGASTAAPADAPGDTAALRAQLDEEHRRTEALTAKLKLAERVNDLIFKIQAQQADAKPGRAKRHEQ